MSVIVVFDPPDTLLVAMVEAAPRLRYPTFLHPRLLGCTVPVVPAPTVVLLPNAMNSSQMQSSKNTVKPLGWKGKLESDALNEMRSLFTLFDLGDDCVGWSGGLGGCYIGQRWRCQVIA
jgi:hypothetical protein